MTKDDIIRMAREAGIEWQSNEGITGRVRVTTCGSQPVEKIERLVQAAYAAGAAAEREACAKVCEEVESRADDLWDKFAYPEDQGMASGARQCADTIRARGEK